MGVFCVKQKRHVVFVFLKHKCRMLVDVHEATARIGLGSFETKVQQWARHYLSMTSFIYLL